MSDGISSLGNHYFNVTEVSEVQVTKRWKLDRSIMKNCYDESELRATMPFEKFIALSEAEDEEVLQSIYDHLSENDPDDEDEECINPDQASQNRSMEIIGCLHIAKPIKKYRKSKMKSRICMKL